MNKRHALGYFFMLASIGAIVAGVSSLSDKSHLEGVLALAVGLPSLFGGWWYLGRTPAQVKESAPGDCARDKMAPGVAQWGTPIRRLKKRRRDAWPSRLPTTFHCREGRTRASS